MMTTTLVQSVWLFKWMSLWGRPASTPCDQDLVMRDISVVMNKDCWTNELTDDWTEWLMNKDHSVTLCAGQPVCWPQNKTSIFIQRKPSTMYSAHLFSAIETVADSSWLTCGESVQLLCTLKCHHANTDVFRCFYLIRQAEIIGPT